MCPQTETQKSAKTRTAAKKRSNGFTAEERAAMKERSQELKASARRGSSKTDGESDVMEKIAKMQEPDRAMAERLHQLIKANAPELSPRTWYGMPAYAKGDKVLCYFQDAAKFKSRYATLGFSDKANLDDGPMWPTVYALNEWTGEVEARVAKLVKQALAEKD
jgi:uncharacterized protein YdhG (YjbR/CyaY superfamily)